MTAEFRRLWRGDLPLARALVGYVVIYGLALNFLMSGVALLAYTLTSSAILTLVLHSAPLPYNALACVGAWRSIERYQGPLWLASLARLSVVGLFILLMFF